MGDTNTGAMQTCYSIGSSLSFTASDISHEVIHASLMGTSLGLDSSVCNTTITKDCSSLHSLCGLPNEDDDDDDDAWRQFTCDDLPKGTSPWIDPESVDASNVQQTHQAGQGSFMLSEAQGDIRQEKFMLPGGWRGQPARRSNSQGVDSSGSRVEPFSAFVSAFQLRKWASVGDLVRKSNSRAQRVLFPESLK